MNYLEKQKQITEQFEAIQKEVGIFRQTIAEKEAELLRFQGEYRLLEEIIKKEKEEKK